MSIENAIIGSNPKKQIIAGVLLARCEQECYLVAPQKVIAVALNSYRKRIGVEEQNRDLKTGLGLRSLYFGRAQRVQRLWNLLGILSLWFYQIYLQYWIKWKDILGRSYKDGRKDLSWFSFAQIVTRKGKQPKAWIPFQQTWN